MDKYNIHLIPIKDFADSPTLLYDLLKERPRSANISHKELPSWPSHLHFVNNHPYERWWLVMDVAERKFVGSAYVTKELEIGIFIFASQQRKGYGEAAVRKIFDVYPCKTLRANIAPGNEPSHALFKKLGFAPLQITYSREPTL